MSNGGNVANYVQTNVSGWICNKNLILCAYANQLGNCTISACDKGYTEPVITTTWAPAKWIPIKKMDYGGDDMNNIDNKLEMIEELREMLEDCQIKLDNIDNTIIDREISNNTTKTLKELAQPLVDWLYINGTPHSTILIDMRHAELLDGTEACTFELRD